MRKHIYTALLTSLIASPALAQTRQARILGTGLGLSSTQITDVTQDKRHRLWVATEEGLCRFDGNRFVTYCKTEDGLLANELNCVLDDPTDNSLWIGTQREGLSRYYYDKGQFVNYVAAEKTDGTSLSANDVTSISLSCDSTIWVSTYWGGVNRYERQTDSFVHYNTSTVKGLPSNQTWTAKEYDGMLYVGHVYDGLSVIDLKKKTARNYRHADGDPTSLPAQQVFCIERDSHGNMWIGTANGLALFDPGKEAFVLYVQASPLLGGSIHDICQVDEGHLWVTTDKSRVAIIDLTGDVRHPEDMAVSSVFAGDDWDNESSVVSCLCKDVYGNVWAGNQEDGVVFVGHGTPYFESYVHTPYPANIHGLTAKNVTCLTAGSDDDVWVGTKGGGINVIRHGGRLRELSLKRGNLTGNSVLSALCTQDGTYWVGIEKDGLYYTSPGNSRKVLDNAEVRCLFEDSDHQLWVGTSGGIDIVDIEGRRVVAHHDCPVNFIWTVYRDKEGNAWVGTYGGGLWIYDRQFQELAHYDKRNGLPSNTCNHITSGPKGEVWVATGAGLVRFRNAQGRPETMPIPILNVSVQALNVDRDGNLWFSTNKGIGCLRTGADSIRLFRDMAGIPQTAFNPGCTARLADGSIFFGSTTGLCHFLPQRVLSDREAPRVTFTDVVIPQPLDSNEGTDVFAVHDLAEGFSVDYRHNTFDIFFTVEDFSLADEAEYAYRVVGISDEWYPVHAPQAVTLRNLPPGEYRLEMKCRMAGALWGQAALLPFTITPPWWLSVWAKILYCLLAMGVVGMLMALWRRKVLLESEIMAEKRETRQREQLNEERLRFYTNVTHELRTPLTLIMGPLEDLKNNGNIQPAEHRQLTLVHHSASRLLELVNGLLDFRKAESQHRQLKLQTGDMAAVVREIGMKYGDLNRNGKIEVRTELEVTSMPTLLDHDAVTTILDNLMSNALKYTEEGLVTIRLRQETAADKQLAIVSVEDTGQGIAPEELPAIFDRYYRAQTGKRTNGTGIGLALAKSLATLHHGTLTAESVVGQGSVFTLTLPIEPGTEGQTDAHPQTDADGTGTEENPCVLVVEDNNDIRDYIAQSLNTHYNVSTAVDGQTGWQIVQTKMPDIIVSDIMMPGMDGMELCRLIKNDVRTSHIPVILLTAKDSFDDQEEGYNSGADSYITKPFRASLLSARVGNLLQARQQLRQLFGTKASQQEREQKRADYMKAISDIDKAFLAKAESFVLDHLETDALDIASLSAELGMSESTLYRKMKALTGVGTKAFITKIRMRRAEELLLSGKYQVGQIAFMVGYGSPSNFRKAFKEEFGVLPADYTKQL